MAMVGQFAGVQPLSPVPSPSPAPATWSPHTFVSTLMHGGEELTQGILAALHRCVLCKLSVLLLCKLWFINIPKTKQDKNVDGGWMWLVSSQ